MSERSSPRLSNTALDALMGAPAFCFTGDTDWAPESMIEETLRIFEEAGVPYTPFVTHQSKAIETRYRPDRARYVGIHPNFLPGSSHGNNFAEVESHAMALWPDAKCVRTHGYFDAWNVVKYFYENGFQYDSSLSLHLQPGLVPLQHSAGPLRFPTFLDDYIYASENPTWDVETLRSLLMTPGLKIFNFHPVHVALNTPTLEYYNQVKDHVRGGDWQAYIHRGRGTRTFLVDLLRFVKQSPGLGVFYLDDLFSQLVMTSREEETFFDTASATTHSKLDYDRAGIEQKANIVKLKYEEIRDNLNIYATSRDVNLRELEIEFFIQHIVESSLAENNRSPRILDLGCGNGYTLIRVAHEVKGDLVGVDFSENMIRAAGALVERFRPGLKCVPRFQLGDVRQLNWDESYFDIVMSARCLLNLPSKDVQFDVIRSVRRLLKVGGHYLMIEGNREGLVRLNAVRTNLGLEAIPDTGDDNVSSLKFNEEEVDAFLAPYFKIEREQSFGMYYFLSRVVYPCLVHPEKPRFKSGFNEVARKIASAYPDYEKLGHLRALVLKAI